MNENTNASASQAAMKTFDIIDGNTLMAQEFKRRVFTYKNGIKRDVGNG